jgi:pimeloyl-ACP methyl ester carboxylesterase
MMSKPIVWGFTLIIAITAVIGVQYLADRRSAPAAAMSEVLSRYGQGVDYVEVAGVDVAYRDEGSGPALVLLHGSFGSLRMFDEMVREIGPGHRIIRYDQPPSGLSGPVPEEFSMSSEAFLGAFLDKLGVSKVSLLGTSSGGIIAYRFAAAFPERTEALILSNIPPSAPVDNAAARSRLPRTLQWSMGTCFELGRPWSQVCWRDFLLSNFWRQERVTEELVDEYYDLNRRTGAFGFTSMTAIMRDDAQVQRFLGAVEAPTLLLWGMRDPVLPPETLDLLASRLKSTDVRIKTLNDVSHYPPLEAPVEVASATVEFLASVLTGSTSENPNIVRKIKGEYSYFRPDSGEIVGHEDWTMVEDAGGARTFNILQRWDENSYVSMTIHRVDENLRPVETFQTRWDTDGWLSSGVYTVAENLVTTVSTGRRGRTTQSLEVPEGFSMVPHPLATDGLHFWYVAAEPGETVDGVVYNISVTHEPTGAALGEVQGVKLTFVGEEAVTTDAGTFDTRHYKMGEASDFWVLERDGILVRLTYGPDGVRYDLTAYAEER